MTMSYTIVNLDTKQVLSEHLAGWSNNWFTSSAEFRTPEEASSYAQHCILVRTKTFTGWDGNVPVNYKVIPFAAVNGYAPIKE